jgi:hypothetical protein
MNQNSLLFVIVIFGDHYILCTFTGPNPVSCYCSSIEKMAVKCQNFINNLFKIGDHHQYIYKIFKHFFYETFSFMEVLKWSNKSIWSIIFTCGGTIGGYGYNGKNLSCSWHH